MMKKKIMKTEKTQTRRKSTISKKDSPNSLIYAAGRLKQTKRSGWISKVGISESESVADHSFRMAILGMLLGEEMSSLNGYKVVRMCLLHDLAESVIGDKMPEEKESETVHRKHELKILRQICKTLPSKARNNFTNDINELMSKETRESLFVWEIDKLEMGLQSIDYAHLGYNKEKLAGFRATKDTALSQPLRQILDSYEMYKDEED